MAASIAKPLTKVSKHLEKDLAQIIESKSKHLHEVHSVPFEMLPEDSADSYKRERAAELNIQRREFNEKLKVYDDWANLHILPHVMLLTEKVIIVFTQLATVVTMAIIIALSISAIAGIVVSIINAFHHG